MIAFASSLDQCGPLTRDVTDAALLFRHMVGKDPCDSTSLEFPEEVALPSAERLDGIRFGVPPELTGEGIEDGVKAVFEQTPEADRGPGRQARGGRAAALAARHRRLLRDRARRGVRQPRRATTACAYGIRAADGDLLSMYEETRAEGFGDEVKRRIMLGTYALSSGYYEAYYGRAQRVRTKIADDFREAFEKVDLIVTPTSPTVAFKLGERTDDPLAMYLADACTVPMPLAGIPAISIPGGLSDGLPVGHPARRPGVQREPDLRRGVRARAGDRLRGGARGVTRDPDRAYEPVIGLEIHVQLNTRTKMFCGCELSFGEEPNTRTCPICLGHPGVLPVINAEAVHYALMIGMALECEIADRSIFHRKQYFYPDNPKAYQISQYDIPICGAGRLEDVRIHRVHLEEDAAKLVHAGASGRIHGAESSVVDFNRCGTPLVEIVTEPDLHDPHAGGRVAAPPARDAEAARASPT